MRNCYIRYTLSSMYTEEMSRFQYDLFSVEWNIKPEVNQSKEMS